MDYFDHTDATREQSQLAKEHAQCSDDETGYDVAWFFLAAIGAMAVVAGVMQW